MSEEKVLESVSSEQLAASSYGQMVDYLENLLMRQVERLRKYDLDGATELGEEANRVAAAISREKILERPEFSENRWRIEKLYKDLGLIIASERQEVSEKLRQIRMGLKTLGAYSENV